MTQDIARAFVRITAWVFLLLGVNNFVLTILLSGSEIQANTSQEGVIFILRVMGIAASWLFGGILAWALLMLAARASEHLAEIARNSGNAKSP